MEEKMEKNSFFFISLEIEAIDLLTFEYAEIKFSIACLA